MFPGPLVLLDYRNLVTVCFPSVLLYSSSRGCGVHGLWGKQIPPLAEALVALSLSPHVTGHWQRCRWEVMGGSGH